MHDQRHCAGQHSMQDYIGGNYPRRLSETLWLIRHSFKKVYGISAGHYKGSEKKEPLASTSKGSGASPAVWLSICIVLITLVS